MPSWLCFGVPAFPQESIVQYEDIDDNLWLAIDLTILQRTSSISMSTKKKGSISKAIPKSLSEVIDKVLKVIQSSYDKIQIEESNINQKLLLKKKKRRTSKLMKKSKCSVE